MMTDPETGKSISVMMERDSDRTRGLGLSYWMERVLEEVDAASRELSADRVHDLRVVLRRCRSMAKGFMVLDPDKTWGTLQKQGRQLFRRLGKLRDVQVLQEWLGRLSKPDDPALVAMSFHLGQSEQELKRAAGAALRAFDHDRWRGCMRRVRARARRLPVGGAVFQLSALQDWTRLHGCHEKALRDRTPSAWHRLRLAIKQFRYTVENFLPQRHAEWGPGLKDVQDCLGEAQDLYVFWQAANRLRVFPDPATRARWRLLVQDQRTARIDRYRTKMVGPESLLRAWRKGLPPQSRVRSISLRMIEKWAFFHRLDLARVRRVRSVSLQLFNGLHRDDSGDAANRRSILHLAAILHELGRGNGNKHDGAAARLLRRLPPAPGFTAESLLCAAMVILGHRGKSRSFEGEEYANLPETQRRLIMELSGILRLARVLALDSVPRIGSLDVRQSADSIVVFVAGYPELGPLAEKAAQARHLLEVACQRPVIIRNADSRPSMDNRPARQNGEPHVLASDSPDPAHTATTNIP